MREKMLRAECYDDGVYVARVAGEKICRCGAGGASCPFRKRQTLEFCHQDLKWKFKKHYQSYEIALNHILGILVHI